MVRGSPCICIIQSPQRLLATAATASGSRKPLISLMISTPTSNTARITWGLKVSIDKGTPSGRNPSITGNKRSSSRSEEHTSELQSRGHLVCRLLLEQKNNLEQES